MNMEGCEVIMQNINMGERLRQLRKSKKLTQKQAADRIGIANTLYNKQYCYPIHLNGVKQ